MDLFVGIIGWGDTTYENASRLLDDYLPPEPEILVALQDGTKQPGLTNVIAWMDKVHQEYKLSTHSDILDKAFAARDNAVLIVISTDYLGVELERCRDLGITVLDLTRGLFPVNLDDTEMALGGAEMDADSPAGNEAATTQPTDPATSQGFSEMPPTMEALVKIVKEEVERQMAEYHERHYIDGQPWKPLDGERTLPVPDDEEAKTGELYYRDEAKETYRKKGRRKIKPGEVEVLLTDEEVTQLGDKITG